MNEIISAKNAPAAVGPYSHAVLAGNTLYTSGQLGLDPKGWKRRQNRRFKTWEQCLRRPG